MCAQAAHASVQSVLDYEPFKFRDWVNEGMTKIVVGCDSESELLQLASKSRDKRIITSLIKDAGKTEFKEPTYTCVAIGPDEDDLIDEITGNLKLL